MHETAKARSPINIALIKYWGKRDDVKMLPLNDSVSVTIDALYAETEVTILPEGAGDCLILNGKDEKLTVRHEKVLQRYRQISKTDAKIKITSTTNFPVASGLASSAAGFAALAEALTALGGLNQMAKAELARLGSGSATRSLLSGFVRWRCSDGQCEQMHPRSQWPELRAVVLVVTDAAKEVPSTAGMQRTVDTSDLLKTRVSVSVPRRLEQLRGAIETTDFDVFARTVMEDSNQLHALCLDTYPPLLYLNETSHKIISLVHELNSGRVKYAYTFDAGPHATIFAIKSDVDALVDELKCAFGDFPVGVGSDPGMGPIRYAVLSEIGGGTKEC